MFVFKNGKIDKYGQLQIKRNDKWIEQYCCLSCNDKRTYRCSDSCPAFRGPEVQYIRDEKLTIGYPVYALELCSIVGTLYFEDFIDERKEEEKGKTLMEVFKENNLLDCQGIQINNDETVIGKIS